MAAVREAKLDITSYGLSNDPYHLHKEINLSLNVLRKLLLDLVNINKGRMKCLIDEIGEIVSHLRKK